MKIVQAYFYFLKVVIALCLALMVILVFGNVVLRYGFNTGITISEELSRWLFVWLTFLGSIVVLREHGHLGVDTLVKHLPRRGKQVCLIVSQVLMLYATWLFLQGSWAQTLINLDVKAPVTGLSMGLFYGVGVWFSLSAGLILLYELYHTLFGKVSEAELIMVKESEEQVQFEELQKELQEHADPDRAGGSGKPNP